ncbi:MULTISPECIES: hypothetical protein [unclassified Brucella]|uniref:hypothetical protein n=1 Tax=unclassified Brucella TaxID=2632610 RepID=UPI000A4E96B9|nr:MULTISPECIES: hypothetical protein [unclassified Brucella]
MADLRLRINELPEELNPAPIDNIAIDGPSTRRTTLQRAADAVRPYSNEAMAREGFTRGPGGTVYGKVWNGAAIVEPEPEPTVVIVPSVTLWERMTDDEAEQVRNAMATQPFRTRQIFLTANTFRSDHELWPLLVQIATDLFGEARAAELLAP